MSFEQTLAALHAMLGASVEIAVGAAEDAPAIVGTWSGRLAAGSELPGERGRSDGETFYFHLHDDPSSGFFLDGGTFRGARWLDREAGSRALLEIRCGALALVVERTGEGPSVDAPLGDRP